MITKLECERTCMAAMAIADGQPSELSLQQIEEHLAGCSDCRQEVGQLRAVTSLLDAHERRPQTEDVWPRVERRLSDAAPAQRQSQVWYPFLILGVLLLGYRIVEMIPNRDFGFLFKLVPIVFVIAVFSYLRENPFKINSELSLEGE